jgi:hypothetical protein
MLVLETKLCCTSSHHRKDPIFVIINYTALFSILYPLQVFLSTIFQ